MLSFWKYFAYWHIRLLQTIVGYFVGILIMFRVNILPTDVGLFSIYWPFVSIIDLSVEEISMP